jgi:hypothetical protein
MSLGRQAFYSAIEYKVSAVVIDEGRDFLSSRKPENLLYSSNGLDVEL